MAQGLQCGIEDELDQMRQADPQGFAEDLAEYNSEINDFLASHSQNPFNCPGGITIIPIAFHIFHENWATTPGQGHNFTNIQLRETVRALNADFAGYNVDKGNVPQLFQAVDAGHTCIQFCIGKIERYSCASCPNCHAGADQDDLHHCINGGSGAGSANDPDDFLNIYSNNLPGLLGTASCIDGFSGSCGGPNDGVTINWNHLIPSASTAPFNQGRTLTHEVGHWLGLPHIWGDINGGGCGGDDSFSDTPDAANATLGCPASQITCGTEDMIYNYLDYSDDACLIMFTQEQAAWMNYRLSVKGGVTTSADRGNCGSPTVCRSVQSINNQTIDINCGGSVNFIEIMNGWYSNNHGYTFGHVNSFYWSQSGVGGFPIPEPMDFDFNHVGSCTDINQYTFTLTQECWDFSDNEYEDAEDAGTVTVNVHPCTACLPPVADFEMVGNAVFCPDEAPYQLTFVDQSLNSPTYWNWVFSGAGVVPTTSNDQNPTVIVNSAGSLDVSLTTGNSAGVNNILKSYIVNMLSAGDFGCGIAPCTQFQGGPYTNFYPYSGCSNLCTPIQPGFEAWENEAYILGPLIMGVNYTFDFCTGYDPGLWDAVITIAAYSSGFGPVPGSEIITVNACSVTFTVPTDGIYIAVISGLGNCGGPLNSTDNGLLSFSCDYNDCPSVCGTQFHDSGGVGGDYSNNESETYVFCPDNPGEYIEVEFTFLDIEENGPYACYDLIKVFDGPSNTSPYLGSYCGYTTTPFSFVSTDPSGCITAEFYSDGSVTDDGWEATIHCHNNCTQPVDCLGICGGTAVVDACGVCDGPGIPPGDCDCYGSVLDCTNVCGGNAVVDVCGVCNGTGIPNGDCDCFGNQLDCLGVCGGTAVVDACGVCDGPGIPAGDCDCSGNQLDCTGVCGGSAVHDECGVCNGGGIPVGDCDCNGNQLDCAGVCGGDADVDICGVCDGPGIPAGACDCNGSQLDCAGQCGGNAVLDACGTCNGPGLIEWFYDIDNDGLGDPDSTVLSCTQPSGFVANDDDDCDGAYDVCNICNGPGEQMWYEDADGDGKGNPDSFIISCASIPGYVDNFDDDCDGSYDNCSVCNGPGEQTYYPDMDGDGLGDPGQFITSCQQPTGYVSNGDDDCDGAYDACNICNGQGEQIWYEDADGDGLGNYNVSIISCTPPAGYVANANDDCDGVIDECGICDGGGIPPGFCDCNGNINDCAGICGGVTEVDECGVCGGNGIPQGDCDCAGNQPDCNGICGGSAVIDECGICDGNGIAPGACDCAGNVLDCAGVCGGPTQVDECGVCGGNGIPVEDCDCDGNQLDCNGICGGGAVVDACGICEGDHSSCSGCDGVQGSGLIEDCLGVCGGSAVVDECDVCDGPGIPQGDCDCEGNVIDCLGVCGGSAVVDECGVCNGAGIPEGDCDCEGNQLDCLGDCGGSAIIDECGECAGEGITQDACDCEGNELDCLGICGGSAVLDECGNCNGSGIPEGDCDCEGNELDCFGICGGNALPDECGICGGNGIPQGFCDCEGNVLDCAGVCGGSDTSCVDQCSESDFAGTIEMSGGANLGNEGYTLDFDEVLQITYSESPWVETVGYVAGWILCTDPLCNDILGYYSSEAVVQNNGQWPYAPNQYYIAPVVYYAADPNPENTCFKMGDVSALPLEMLPENNCESYAVQAVDSCEEDSEGNYSFNVIITLEPQGESFSIQAFHENGFSGEASHSFIDGPFTDEMAGYHYVITPLNNLSCPFEIQVANVSCIATAIELIDFTGQAQTAYNLLEWKTSSEKDILSFNLYHSSNGIDFNHKAEVEAENLIRGSSYSFKDYDFSGLDYYQLRSTDVSGAVHQHSVLRIKRDPSDWISFYPNPASDYIIFEWPKTDGEIVELSIFNSVGKKIKVAISHENSALIRIEELAPGMYWTKINWGDKEFYTKFLKQ